MIESVISQLIEFVGQHRDWAMWLAFVFAAAETTAILSILIPSTAILVGVGALVAAGGLDFRPIWIGASLGALTGSSFSWWLGWRYGDKILQMWPLRNHPEFVARGQASFAKYGGFAIIIGHFVGPLRPVMFFMTGMSAMPFWRFAMFNIVGGTAWAYAIPKSGQIGGTVLGALWALITGA